jgi:hypothetical protein
MTEKTPIATADGATAALFSVAALAQALARKGLLSPDELNEAFAVAASMCRGNGNPGAAQAIELMVPTSVGIDVVAHDEEIRPPGEDGRP